MSFLVPLRPLHPNKVHEMASVGLMSVPNPNLCEKNSNLTWSYEYVIWLAGLTSCPSRMSLRYQSSQATSVSRATVFGRCRDVSELEPLCGDRPFRKSTNTQCFAWAYLKIVASNSLVRSSSPTKCLSGTLGAPKFWELERVIGRRIQKALTSPKTIKAKNMGIQNTWLATIQKLVWIDINQWTQNAISADSLAWRSHKRNQNVQKHGGHLL